MVSKQFTLYLVNKPGVLAGVAQALSDARINIEGISASVTPDVGLVQVIVNKAAATRKVLKRIGVSFVEQDVAVVSLDNTPGALARMAAKMAKAGVNINYLYGTSCAGDCRFSLVLSASNLKKASAVMDRK